MKYDDFKIFKFSTILKIVDFRRYNFSKIYKSINFKRYKYILIYLADFVVSTTKYVFSRIYKSITFIRHNFLRIYKSINFKRYKYILIYLANFVFSIAKYVFSEIYKRLNFRRSNFSKTYRYLDFRRANFSKIYRYFDFRRFNFSKIYRYLDIKKYKNVPVYFVSIVVFSALIYLSMPMFFNYDKSKLENTLCKDINLKCLIDGKIRYSFFPSPRIKIKNLIIHDFVDKNKTLGKIENVVIKLSFYNLSNKNKFNFTKIELRNAKMNFDLHGLKENKSFFKKKFVSKPINLKKGEINFFDGKKSIATITNINFKYKANKNAVDVILKGNFLNDDIYINLKNKKQENDLSTVFILKFLDTKIKVDVFDSDFDQNILNGSISFKKGKSRLTSIFDYKDAKIIFKQANLRNIFLDGKFNGDVKFLPYFNFNLNVDLNSINFNRLHSSLIALDETQV